ncbi:succinylglutamate desuccinylase/aspartoacylase family protein [Aquimarina muelleri]|uniref:Succinylglutamate desuccinylase n=1 Tax=Aquimarina muelleri TaxID=279356 RepID=A0A918N209_9FLAO|nr:succinylglutamate desuccinylase/aspartoacylase family protein [Aquimarina muelleri]MCX2761619.1 succinylglutamate desuccinylase/aspartoacylase family protein [Aquimarina muelleri]GGX07530.1 succinylglutamate desuccinylase [Aquimarina muelleri]
MAKRKVENILNILGKEVLPGTSTTINFNIAKLYTSTKVEIPIIIERSKVPGPIVLITAGIHGDEINGVEVVRQIIAKKINKPVKGSIICIPVLNVFGFLNMDRFFPDGRDLNRVFPGTKKGSLASRFAYQFVNEILPVADFCLDFHTGGASRFNAPHIRVDPKNERLVEMAKKFNAPFTLLSKNLDGSYRAACAKKGKDILLFEGGKSQNSSKEIAIEGVKGTMRILHHLEMLDTKFEVPIRASDSIIIKNSFWVRAKYSGLLHIKIPISKHVVKGEILATITDPYGKLRHVVKSTNDGYVINLNEAPIVYQGDAIFHITKELVNE